MRGSPARKTGLGTVANPLSDLMRAQLDAAWQSKTTLKASPNSSTRHAAEEAVAAWKDEQIALALAELALLYWRPDFSPGQAKRYYATYLDDLREFALADIRAAIVAWRRAPDAKRFPYPGELRALICAKPNWWPLGSPSWIAEQKACGASETADLCRAVETALPTPAPVTALEDRRYGQNQRKAS